MRRYRRNPHCAARVVDGLAFVITPDDNKLHTLNEQATLLWQLAAHPLGAEAAAGALMMIYEVDAETALADAAAWLEDFASRDILVPE